MLRSSTIPTAEANARIATAGRWPLLAVLCAAQLVAVLNFQIVAIALPRIATGLGLAAADLQWVMSANALAFGGFLLLGGRAGDLFGHRRIFMLGLALSALASLACGLAPSTTLLIAARAAQGVGTALFVPATVALIANAFVAGPARDRALGLWAAAGPLGGMVSIGLGGAVADILGWRAVFLISVPLAAIPLLLAPNVLPCGERKAGHRLDIPGAITGTLAVAALVYGFDQAARIGLVAPSALAALGAGLLLLLAFIAIERRAPAPLLPGGLLRRGGIARTSLVTFFHGAATNTPIVFIALYLQGVRGATLVETGLAFLPCNLALIAGATVGARVTARAGARWTMVAGLAAMVVGLLVLSRLAADSAYGAALLPGLLIEGVGIGLAQVGIVRAVTAGAAAADQGVGAGVMNTAAQLGTAVGLAILTAVAATRAPSGTTEAVLLVSGYQWAFRAGAALALIGLLIALLAPSGLRTSGREP